MKSPLVCLFAALAALLAWPPAARAQDPNLNIVVDGSGNPVWLLDGSDVSINERGFGTPTVVWDATAQQYVMYYEMKLTQAYLFNAPDNQTLPGLGLTPSDYDDCRLGRDPSKGAVVWAIGRATSPDGFTWVAQTKPVLIPSGYRSPTGPDPVSTYYTCQAAQPVVRLDSSGHWYMWFKAMQWNPNNTSPARVDPCFDVGDTGDTGTTRTWPYGCTRVTGIGFASSTDGITWTPSAMPAIPTADILTATGGLELGIGYPRVVRLGDLWDMTFTVLMPKPLNGASPANVYQATSTTADSGWTIESTPALIPGSQSWMETRVTFGATWCDDASPPMHAVFEGENLDPSTSAVLEQDLGAATSYDGYTWLLSQYNPMADAAAVANWDTWALMDVNSDHQLLLWYSASPDGGGSTPKNIGFATTGAVSTTAPYADWNKNDLNDRFCAALPSTDTGLDTGTDTGTDTGIDTGTDTGIDTGVDTGTDTGIDTGTDTGLNDTGDTGLNDTGQVRGGCGCTSTPSGPGTALLLLPLVALAMRRRRFPPDA